MKYCIITDRSCVTFVCHVNDMTVHMSSTVLVVIQITLHSTEYSKMFVFDPPSANVTYVQLLRVCTLLGIV